MKLILLRLEAPGLDYWHDKTLVVTSKWAGIAGMDIALQAWAKALQDEGINVRVVTHSFCERDNACQKMLACIPSHQLFSDLNTQLSDPLTKTILRKQLQIRQKFLGHEHRLRGGSDPATRAALKKAHVEEFKMSVESLLAATCETAPLEALCKYHGRPCPVMQPQAAADDGKVVWLEVASPSCTAWSARGLRLGWLSTDNVTTLLWGHGFQSEGRKPDMVVGENVPSFDLRWWMTIAGDAYEWHHTVFNPMQIGVPVSGDRLWWICYRRATMQCTAAEPLGEARFCQAIYADIAADASMYLLASKDQQREFEDHINKNGAKLSLHPRGKRHKCEHYLSVHSQLRLEEHRAEAVRIRREDPSLCAKHFFWDISQSVGHSRNPDSCIPRPTTSSIIFSEKAQLVLHPLEVWACQGP